LEKQKKILIAEDEKQIREILADTLKQNDYSTIESINGKETIELALKEHPDLILLDILMPIMNGMDALKVIRDDDWGMNVPVIIMTNLNATDEQLVQDMIKYKPLYYLIKSDWKIKDILIKIKEVLT
jgi:CheY-like chemotaxis protein